MPLLHLDILIPPERYGVFSEFLMALYAVAPGTNANMVIPDGTFFIGGNGV